MYRSLSILTLAANRSTYLFLGASITFIGLGADILRNDPHPVFGSTQLLLVITGSIVFSVGLFPAIARHAIRFMSRQLNTINSIHEQRTLRLLSLSWPNISVAGSLLFFCFIAIVFFMDRLILGSDAPIRMHDAFETDWTRMKEMGRLVAEYGLFNWFPNIGAGVPANAYHYGPQHPVVLLSSFIPIWALYTAASITLMAAAGFGMYLLLRKYIALSQHAALMGGLLYCFNSQIQPSSLPHVVFNFVFPLFFILSFALITRRLTVTVRLTVVASLVLLTALSYVPLTLPIFSIFQILIIFLFKNEQDYSSTRLLIYTIAVWIAYCFYHLPIIYSLFEFLPYYHRDQALISEFFKPDFFTAIKGTFFQTTLQAGALPFLIACIPFAVRSCHVRKAIILVTVPLIIASVFSSNLSDALPSFITHLDLDHFSWTIPICLTILIAVLANEFRSRSPTPTICVFMALAIPIAIIIYMFSVATENYTQRLIIFNSAIFVYVALAAYVDRTNAWLVKARWNQRLLITSLSILIAIAVINVKDGRMKGPGFENERYYSFFENHPELRTVSDAMRKQTSRGASVGLPPAIFQSYGVETIDAKGPVFFSDYKKFFEVLIFPPITSNNKRQYYRAYPYDLYLQNDLGMLNFDLLQLLNVSHLISRSPLICHSCDHLEERRADSTQGDNPIFIYALKQTLGRAYLASEVALVDDTSDITALLADSAERLANGLVLIRQKDLPKSVKGTLDGATNSNAVEETELNLEHYSPDRISYRVNIGNPKYLVITNSYHHKWHAYLNGVKVPLIPANLAFQALYIPDAGSHTVVLKFHDPVLIWSYSGMILALVIFLVIGFRRHRNAML